MTTHPSAAILQTSAVALPLGVLVVVALTWLTLTGAERSALTYRAAVAVSLAVGVASLAGRPPLDLTTYAALAAALLVPLRHRVGGGLLTAAALGALARGDLEVHQRVVLGGVVVGVLAAVVGTLVWEQLDPLRDGAADLDHLDAIIDGTCADAPVGAGQSEGQTPHPRPRRGVTRHAEGLSPRRA